jgi:hypothetical protein
LPLCSLTPDTNIWNCKHAHSPQLRWSDFKMKAIFGRKVSNLAELKEITEGALKQGHRGQSYCVTKEVLLEDKYFHSFGQDFFNDQPWITKEDGGVNKNREVRCIRVINKYTGEKVLVNNEGYSYPRYTAIENN